MPVLTGLINISAPAGCVLAGPNYQCTVSGPIAVGASVTGAFTCQISAASASTVTVAGSVSSVTPTDPVSDNNNTSFNTTITAGSDVSISKTRSPSGAVFVGDPEIFTLSGQYTGDNVNGIVIRDVIPANYSITSAAGPRYVCTITGQTVRCTRTTGSGPGANVSLGSITITTTAITVDGPRNTASISTTGPVDPNPANNSAIDGGATITQSTADLRANKSGPNPALVVVGNTYTYDISTTNLGNRPFFGTVQMTDSLPAGLTLSATALNGWTCSPPPVIAGPVNIECTRDYTAGAPLTVGETTPFITFSALVTGTCPLNNGLSVTSPNPSFPDPDLTNNAVTVGVVSSAAVASAHNVAIIDTLANDLTFVSASPSSGSCTTTPPANFVTASGSNQVICNLGTIGNGSQQSVTIIVGPNNARTLVSPITNNVSVVTSNPETYIASNSASAITAVALPDFDLQMDKRETIHPVAVGEDTVYGLTATKAGPSAVENMVVSDPLPCVDRLGADAQTFGHLAHRVATILDQSDCIAIELICDYSSGHLVPLAFKITKQGVYKSRGYSLPITDDIVVQLLDRQIGGIFCKDVRSAASPTRQTFFAPIVSFLVRSQLK